MKACLAKADEALKAAEVCHDNGLYDSCVSRSYYAMFWAAIAALEYVGYAPQEWSHGGLANVFGKELVKKHRFIPRKLAAHLKDAYQLRRLADYERNPINAKRAKRALNHAQNFVSELRKVVS